MKVDLPGRQGEFPQITVVVSGITSDLSKTNGEDAASTATLEEGVQVAEQGGLVIHKDVVGIFSRRVVALENRMERIERQIESLKSKFNGRLARIEDKLKALLKVQREITRKLDDMVHVRPLNYSASGGLSIVDHLPLEQKRKRMWAAKSPATSSAVAQIARGKYQRAVKSSPYSKSSFVKYYKRMRKKQAALAVPQAATADGSIALAIPLASIPHELSWDGIGSSSASTSGGHGMGEPQLE